MGSPPRAARPAPLYTTTTTTTTKQSRQAVSAPATAYEKVGGVFSLMQHGNPSSTDAKHPLLPSLACCKTPRSASSSPSSSRPAPFSCPTRTDSGGSAATVASADSDGQTQTAAAAAAAATAGENPRKAATGSVNANSYCGRHSEQYLLSGWGDVLKGVFHPKKN